MEQYCFSNHDINNACEQVGKFLDSSGVERREALRIKFTFEEALLEYQAKFGEDAIYKLKCTKRLSSARIEIIVQGESFNPFDKGDSEDVLINSLLAGISLAPTWSYKNSRNYIIFIPKKKPVSQTVKMLVAIAVSVVAGFALTLLPDSVRVTLSDMLLTPLTDLYMGLMSAIAGPLIFLSVLGSICSMGNMETLGKIGKKTVMVIFTYMIVISIGMTAICSLFYQITGGSGGNSDFSQVLTLIYDIVPSNLIDPFLTGNALQLIFIAVIFGTAMLVLASKVNGVFSIVDQFSYIVQTIMGGLSSMLPIVIFVIFTNMIASGNLKELLSSWKMLLIILLLFAVYFVCIFLWISVRKKVPLKLLFRKALPTLMIALTTASSAAAFATNVRDAQKEFGVDKKLVEFGIPLGQVLYMPGFVALLLVMELTFAEANGIPITFSWLFLAFIINLLLSFAMPPIPGGALTGFTIAFTQLGIPLEVLGIAIAVDAITDFPATAINTTGWQLTLIDVADSLGLLNKEALHKDKASAAK